MIVWGECRPGGTQCFNDGGRYDPVADQWVNVSTNGAPSPRYGHSAVWTGVEMIVWGGMGPDHGPLNDGARYNPTADTWTATSVVGAPSPRFGQPSIWIGSEMVIWGGAHDGGTYDPQTDTWAPLTNPPVN